jgi:ABC-type dipeptide/oligopeptide/nickel transport system ATPase component
VDGGNGAGALPPLLEVRNLHTEFRAGAGVVPVVDGISYTVERGETIAIVGESGSGKTAGALSILRLIPDPPGSIAQGQILFAGRDLLRLSDEEIRQVRGGDIGMIFQEPMTSLNPVLTIGRQIALACDPKLITADEPTMALDVTIQAQILELMSLAACFRSNEIAVETATVTRQPQLTGGLARS